MNILNNITYYISKILFYPTLNLLILSILIIFSVRTKLNLQTNILIIVCFILLYILYNSQTGTNLLGSVPSVGIPHYIGLDGISPENRYLGDDL